MFGLGRCVFHPQGVGLVDVGSATSLDNSLRFNADILSQFLRKVYNGFDTESEIEPGIWGVRCIQGTSDGA